MPWIPEVDFTTPLHRVPKSSWVLGHDRQIGVELLDVHLVGDIVWGQGILWGQGKRPWYVACIVGLHVLYVLTSSATHGPGFVIAAAARILLETTSKHEHL